MDPVSNSGSGEPGSALNDPHDLRSSGESIDNNSVTEFVERFESSLEQKLLEIGYAPDPIAKVLTSEHISEGMALRREELRLEDDQHKRTVAYTTDDNQSKRRLAFQITIVVFCGVAALCWIFLFYGKGDLLQPIVTHLVAVLFGAFGGFGIGRYKKSEQDE